MMVKSTQPHDMGVEARLSEENELPYGYACLPEQTTRNGRSYG
jgi:hypothetical protein